MNTLFSDPEIKQLINNAKIVSIISVVCWLLWLLAPSLTPFACAIFLAWLGNPLAKQLQRFGRSRNTSVCMVFVMVTLLLILALIILVPLIENQVLLFINVLPQGRDWLMGTAIPWFEKHTGLEVALWLDPERLIAWGRLHWQQAGGIAKTLLNTVSRSGFAMINWGINIALLPVLTFYFMRDWDKLIEGAAALIPRAQVTIVTQLATRANDALGALIRGQFFVMLSLGCVYSIGLTLAGLNLGLLIGIISGLISFIPYLGSTTGVLLGLAAAIMQAKGINVQLLTLVGIVFAIGQLLESYVLTPRIVGDRIGLHPVTVILAVMAGEQLFGFLGMLLALPVSAVGNVVLRYAHTRYQNSDLYQHIQSAIQQERQSQRTHLGDAGDRNENKPLKM